MVASLDPARNAKAIETLKAKSNGRVIGVPTDLNDAAAVDALFKKTLAEFGRLDILVNNATNVSQGSFFQMDEAAWDHAFDHKLRGTVRCIRHAVPPMRERKWGRIVNISGGAAWTPQLGAITTGINNAAVQNLTVALANELGKDGILVNAVVPTAIRTDRHDKNIKDTMAKTGQSEAEVLKPRVAKIPLGPHGNGGGSRRRGRVPVVRACQLRHRQRLGGRWRRVGAVVDSGSKRGTVTEVIASYRQRATYGSGDEYMLGSDVLKRFAICLATWPPRWRSHSRRARAAGRLSEPAGHHRSSPSRPAARATCWRASSASGSTKSCTSRSSSRTGPAPAATSPPSRSRARRPTATRC